MEDTKPLVTENWEFRYRVETLIVALFGKSVGLYSDARNKIDGISIENVSTTEMFWIETLIEEMKSIVIGDNWGGVWKSRIIIERRCFWKFRTIRIPMQRTKSMVSTSTLLHKCYVLYRVLDGGVRSCTGWGIQVWKFIEIVTSTLFWKFRSIKTLMKVTQIDNFPSKIFPIERSSTTRKCWLPTPLKEIKVCEIRVRISKRTKKFKLKCFPRK